MQAVHIGGGAISPAVAAHLQKQKAPPSSSGPCLPGTVGFGDGGCGAPQVRKHVHQQFGAGFISPAMLRHLAGGIGGGNISPSMKRHLSQFGGGLVHPAVVRHVKG